MSQNNTSIRLTYKGQDIHRRKQQDLLHGQENNSKKQYPAKRRNSLGGKDIIMQVYHEGNNAQRQIQTAHHNKKYKDKICCQNIHPSIFYTCLIHQSSRRGGWSLSQQSLGERRATPWTGHQSITGPHRDKQPHTLTPKDNFTDTN